MNIPENLKYSQDHEWLKVDGEFALVGITAHAANELGDIVFLDIPSVGETLDKDEVFGSIEAVKTVADLLLPVGGEVVEFNEALEGEPAPCFASATAFFSSPNAPAKRTLSSGNWMFCLTERCG